VKRKKKKPGGGVNKEGVGHLREKTGAQQPHTKHNKPHQTKKTRTKAKNQQPKTPKTAKKTVGEISYL